MTALSAFKTVSLNYLRDSVSAPAVSNSQSPQSKHSLELIPLLDGSDGTYQSLEVMAQAVRGEIGPDYSGFQDEWVKGVAESVCVGRTGHTREQIAALFQFVTQRIEYVLHPMNMQVCQDARRTIEIGNGDCVSMSVLLTTLLACLGYKPYFIAQFVDGEEASHVYVGLRLNGEEIRLDPVAKNEPMGWSQPTDDGGFELEWRIFNET